LTQLSDLSCGRDWWLQESRDADVTGLESRVTQLESECRGHVVKMAAIRDERRSLTNQLRELSRRQRQVSSDWLSARCPPLSNKVSYFWNNWMN